jgi:hypothetical protein
VAYEDGEIRVTWPLRSCCPGGRLELGELEMSHQRVAQVFRMPAGLHGDPWMTCSGPTPMSVGPDQVTHVAMAALTHDDHHRGDSLQHGRPVNNRTPQDIRPATDQEGRRPRSLLR